MKLDALCTYSQTIANVKYHYNILNNQSFLKITVPIGSPAKFMLKLIDCCDTNSKFHIEKRT